jgi:hypothetical protein
MPVRLMTAGDNTLRAIPDSLALSFVLVAASVDQVAFIADGPYEVIAAREVHETAGTDGSAVTLDIKKVTGTTAGASGTTVLASTFDLKSTAKTVVTKNGASGLTATLADRRLAAGDRLYLDFTGTLTALVGGMVTIYLKRLQTAGGSL